MFYSEDWPGKPDPEKVYQRVHDAAYEMTAFATSPEAKLLGYLLMMVAEESERLSWAKKIGSTRSIRPK